MVSTSTDHPVKPTHDMVSISISIHLRENWHLRVVTLLQMLDAASEGTLSVAKAWWGDCGWDRMDMIHMIEIFPCLKN